MPCKDHSLFYKALFSMCLADHSRPPNKLATHLQLENVCEGVCVWGSRGSKGGGSETDRMVLIDFWSPKSTISVFFLPDSPTTKRILF